VAWEVLSQEAKDEFRACSLREFQNALRRDGFAEARRKKGTILYQHPDGRRVTVHFHPGKELRDLAKFFLVATRWTEHDLRRLKLIR